MHLCIVWVVTILIKNKGKLKPHKQNKNIEKEMSVPKFKCHKHPVNR